MNMGDAIPTVLLVLFASAVGVGATLVFVAVRLFTRNRHRHQPAPVLEWEGFSPPPKRAFHLSRPAAWLAIRSRNLHAVQSALGLHHTKPCSWTEGLAGEEKLFIAPPVKG